jgi:23S rRNA pseudouridine2605 synthase
MNAPPRSLLTLKRGQKADAAPALEERLHKVLANAGLGSRRLLEQRIQNGEAKVNSEVATLGLSVKAGDRVELDGKLFVVMRDDAEHTQVLVYHKPEGVMTTRDDPEGRPTVFEQLPRLKGARWIAVGRLDINTTGLLLLTTDGALANALMHPSGGLEREYICRVHGEVPDEILERLKAGVELEDGPAHFDEIGVISRSGSHSWFRVVIKEGRNREVRRMWESQGFLVSRLKRVRYGNIELPRGLKRGNCEELAPDQIKALRQACGAGTAEPTLTLQPVIHQRRAAPISGTEVRPSSRSPQAWTGAYHNEARELTAFDRIREDSPSRPGGRGRKPRPTGGREVDGNVLRPDRAKRAPGGSGKPRRGAAPGQEVFIPKTWSAGDEFGRSGNTGRGPGGPPRGRSDGPRGPRPDNRGNRAPAPAGDNRGNRAGAGDNAWSNSTPGGAARPAGPGRRPGGPGGKRAAGPGGGGNRSGGPGGGGNRAAGPGGGNRSGGPGGGNRRGGGGRPAGGGGPGRGGGGGGNFGNA